MINVVSVQNLLAPFCRTFLCLVVLASSSKFQSYIYKLQADSNILVSPEAGRGKCLPMY